MFGDPASVRAPPLRIRSAQQIGVQSEPLDSIAVLANEARRKYKSQPQRWVGRLGPNRQSQQRKDKEIGSRSRRPRFHNHSAHCWGGKRRLFQKCVYLCGQLLFVFITGESLGSKGHIQPDLRAGRQVLENQGLFRELLAGITLCAKAKDNLGQHNERVLSALVCRLKNRVQVLTALRRGNRNGIPGQTGLCCCSHQRKTGKKQQGADALQA